MKLSEVTLEEIESQMDEISRKRDELTQKLRGLHDKWERLKTKQIKALGFDIDMFTPELLDNELAQFDRVTAAHELVKKFYGHFTPVVSYSGNIYYEEGSRHYPIPQVMFTRRELVPPEALEALRRIAAFVGEDELFISVFEHTLSKYGSYNISWAHGTDKARLIKRTFLGHPDTLKEGTLHEVLEYVSSNHWYEEQ